MSKRILVTGGAGYLGSVLVPHLLRNGFNVRVLDKLVYNQTGLLPLFIDPAFEFIEGDVCDEETVKQALEGIDVVVHLAALVGAPLCKAKPDQAWKVNYESAMLVERLRTPGQKYIYPNSTSGYGTRKPVDGLCTEETPQEPISVYGASKVKAEQELLARPDVATLRFTTVFGLSPRLRLDLMPNDFMWKAIRQGALIVFEPEYQRSFIHVTDIARAITFTIDNFDSMKGRAFNVGHESMNKTKRELAQKIADMTGCLLEFNEFREDPDKRNYFISFNRIQDAGFTPEIGWEEGLSALHAGLKSLHWQTPYANVEYY